jgi:hypothetical protein
MALTGEVTRASQLIEVVVITFVLFYKGASL